MASPSSGRSDVERRRRGRAVRAAPARHLRRAREPARRRLEAGPQVGAVDLDVREQLATRLGGARRRARSRRGGRLDGRARAAVAPPARTGRRTTSLLASSLDALERRLAAGRPPARRRALARPAGHHRGLDRARSRRTRSCRRTATRRAAARRARGSSRRRPRRRRCASAQPLEVALRIGQPVGVVDAEAVDHALPVQVEQHRVGRVEDVGQLDAHRDQRVDVEEPPVVEDARPSRATTASSSAAPRARSAAESPRSSRARSGSTWSRVAEHPLAVVLAERQSPVGEHLVERLAQDRQADAPAAGSQSTSNQCAYADVPPVRAACPRAARLRTPGAGIAMWFGTTSTTMPEPVLRARSPARPRGPRGRRGPRTRACGRRRRSRASSRAPPAGSARGRGARRRAARGTARSPRRRRSRTRRAAAAGRSSSGRRRSGHAAARRASARPPRAAIPAATARPRHPRSPVSSTTSQALAVLGRRAAPSTASSWRGVEAASGRSRP